MLAHDVSHHWLIILFVYSIFTFTFCLFKKIMLTISCKYYRYCLPVSEYRSFGFKHFKSIKFKINTKTIFLVYFIMGISLCCISIISWGSFGLFSILITHDFDDWHHDHNLTYVYLNVAPFCHYVNKTVLVPILSYLVF